MKSIIRKFYKILKLLILKRQKQPLKKVFWKIVVAEILKNNSLFLKIWAESMGNASKEVDF